MVKEKNGHSCENEFFWYSFGQLQAQHQNNVLSTPYPSNVLHDYLYCGLLFQNACGAVYSYYPGCCRVEKCEISLPTLECIVVTLGPVVSINDLEARLNLDHIFLPLGITEQHESVRQGVGGRGYGWRWEICRGFLVSQAAGFIIVE